MAIKNPGWDSIAAMWERSRGKVMGSANLSKIEAQCDHMNYSRLSPIGMSVDQLTAVTGLSSTDARELLAYFQSLKADNPGRRRIPQKLNAT